MAENALRKGGWHDVAWWFARGYLLVLLLVIAVFGPIFYSLLGWALFASSLYFSFRPLSPRFALSYFLAVYFLVPLGIFSLSDYPVASGLATSSGFAALAALLTAPLLIVLDAQLKRYAREVAFEPAGAGSRLTSLSRALFAAALAVAVVALAIGHLELLFGVALLLGYLIFVNLMTYRRLCRTAVEIPRLVARVVAGNEVVITRLAAGLSDVDLHALLTPRNQWLKVTPETFRLDTAHSEEPLVFEIVPPLSGPVHPEITLSTMDSRGIMQNDMVITPLELHVIPRAKYAEWLARRYLSEGGSGRSSFVTASSSTKQVAEKKVGGEYYQSRDYQPGDSLRDMDWKHTLKLKHLVVRERIEVAERLAVLAVNLSVADAESADKLAYSLITTSMTLSRETVPTAIVAYREDKVVLAMPLSDPRDVLKQSLKLVKGIAAQAGQRCLEPADIAGLKRNLALLEKANSPPAQRLRELLEMEHQAVKQTAAKHILTGALFKVTSRLMPPAAVIMLSEMNHDTEALAVAAERLKNRGFTTYFMEVNGR